MNPMMSPFMNLVMNQVMNPDPTIFAPLQGMCSTPHELVHHGTRLQPSPFFPINPLRLCAHHHAAAHPAYAFCVHTINLCTPPRCGAPCAFVHSTCLCTPPDFRAPCPCLLRAHHQFVCTACSSLPRTLLASVCTQPVGNTINFCTQTDCHAPG